MSAEQFLNQQILELREQRAASDARIEQFEEEVRVLREVMQRAASALDGIKYELDSSVYTLSDSEFESTFYARDILQEAIARGRRGK